MTETAEAILDAVNAAGAWVSARLRGRHLRRVRAAWDLARMPVLVCGYATVSFVRHRGVITAAAIAFFSLLSFAPFMLILGTVSAVALGRSEAGYEQLLEALCQILPFGEERIGALIEGLVSTSPSATGAGFLMLLWTASSAFNLAYESICYAGNMPARFMRRRLVSLVMVLAVVALMLVGFLAASLGPVARAIADLERGPIQGEGFRATSAIVALTLVYKLVAGRNLSWLSALIGGLVSGIVWALGRWVFVSAVVTNLQYGAIYGALTTIVMVLLWVYYSACTLIGGAELAFAVQGRQRLLALAEAGREGEREPQGR